MHQSSHKVKCQVPSNGCTLQLNKHNEISTVEPRQAYQATGEVGTGREPAEFWIGGFEQNADVIMLTWTRTLTFWCSAHKKEATITIVFPLALDTKNSWGWWERRHAGLFRLDKISFLIDHNLMFAEDLRSVFPVRVAHLMHWHTHHVLYFHCALDHYKDVC